jgi:hypothetical protein
MEKGITMRVATLIVATALGFGTCVTTAPAAVISGGHAGGTLYFRPAGTVPTEAAAILLLFANQPCSFANDARCSSSERGTR